MADVQNYIKVSYADETSMPILAKQVIKQAFEEGTTNNNTEQYNNAKYAALLKQVIEENLIYLMNGNVEQQILELLTNTGKPSNGRAVLEKQNNVIKKKKKTERKLTIVSVDGGCQNCHAQQTPQWRYVHREKFCNACYMRIKRWVQGNLNGIKLPCRAKAGISKVEDDQHSVVATDIIRMALLGMKNGEA